MAIYHEIEEIFYGPDLGLSPLARVLLCLRHKLLRDGLCQKAVGRKFFLDATGLTENQIHRALKTLEQKKIIIVQRTMKGKQCLSNEYELNPDRFGKEYNWYANNPTVRIYSGSKGRSYSKKGPLPKMQGVVPPPVQGVPPLQMQGVNELSISELLDIALSKNPSSNNPKENNPSSEENKFSRRSKAGIRKNGEMSLDEVEREKKRQIKMFRDQELKAEIQ